MKLTREHFSTLGDFSLYEMGYAHGASCSAYATFVESRFKTFPSDLESLLHAGIGISGEAGELLDCLKKSWVYGKPIDDLNLHEELGDLLFYITALADLIGTDLGQLMRDNMAKLEKRYPSGYTDADALRRADKMGEPK